MNSGPFLDKWNYWFKTTEGKRIYLNRNAKDIDVNNIYDYKLSYDEKIGMVFEPKPKSELKIYVISGYSSTVTSYAFTKDGLIFSYENNYNYGAKWGKFNREYLKINNGYVTELVYKELELKIEIWDTVYFNAVSDKGEKIKLNEYEIEQYFPSMYIENHHYFIMETKDGD